jgi:hypothetical protein
MKKSSDTVENRTRDLPACTAVPQPTALPAACPRINIILRNYLCIVKSFPAEQSMRCGGQTQIRTGKLAFTLDGNFGYYPPSWAKTPQRFEGRICFRLQVERRTETSSS